MPFSLGYISRYVLIVTAIISVFYYKKYKHTPLRYFPYYLTYAAVLEIVGNELWKRSMYNIWWYNIGINIEILFYLFVFYQYIRNKRVKVFTLVGGIIYELYFLISYLFLSSSWNTDQAVPFAFGAIILIITIFLFLVEMFNSDEVLYVGKYLIFWIAVGLLFYNIIPLPMTVAKLLITFTASSKESRLMLYNIQYVANLLMYFSFIYGFIWSSMTFKSS